ncbi:MAG TPA: hypothetical protein VGD64_11920 [Acidisarcina sp.]
MALLFIAGNRPAAAQVNIQVYSVAAAKEAATKLEGKAISVKGHFWWGKEGSMIYDSYYKAILTVQYSNAFNAKHPGLEFFLPNPRRKSNIATITGRISHKGDERVALIADDIEFAENPR